jgi:EpsD family peptidyl-prolyl cis-trans isomerase
VLSLDTRPGRCASLLAGAALLLCACGDRQPKAGEVVATVNGEAITAVEVDALLGSARNAAPPQAEAARRQVLERLVDQTLAVQRAQELQLDREPAVLQQIEAARREVIARAYAQRVAEAAKPPSGDEIKAYYDANPALFQQRRVYSLQQLAIDAAPEQIEPLKARLLAARSVDDFIAHLDAQGIAFTADQAVRASEQLPRDMLEAVAGMKPGQAALLPAADGVRLIVVGGSRPEPVDEAGARPLIEQALRNEGRRTLVEADRRSLRATAKIELLAAPASAEAAAAAPTAASAASAPASGD